MPAEWHGWIVIEREEGFRDKFICEVKDATPRRQATFFSPAEAVEWWDNKVGERVNLFKTPIGAFRVYTGFMNNLEDEEKEDPEVPVEAPSTRTVIPRRGR